MDLLLRQPLNLLRVLNQLFTIQRVVCLAVMGYIKLLLKAEKEKGRHSSRHKDHFGHLYTWRRTCSSYSLR